MGNKELIGKAIKYIGLLGGDVDSFTVELSITNKSRFMSDRNVIDHVGSHDTFKKFIEDGILVDRMNEYWVEVSKRDEK